MQNSVKIFHAELRQAQVNLEVIFQVGIELIVEVEFI